MTIKKAKEIVGDMVLFHFYSEEINDKIDKEILQRLENYELKDMLVASEIVGKHNREETIDDNGVKRTTRQLNVAPRLIAAMYVLLNYHSTPSDNCEPIISNRKKSLYVVH